MNDHDPLPPWYVVSMSTTLSPTETTMWSKEPRPASETSTDAAINDKYTRGEQRIVTETNREKLPNVVLALKSPGYMNMKPFYQRRKRWDEKRQSKLIESFVMNIPVPPIFIYEQAFNQYEIMDGQQRVTAISRFYNNEYKLTGLIQWPELNGRTYATLPSQIRSGIDRRTLSSIVLLKESAPSDEEATMLRQMVFERLNTGGVELQRQEIRNCLNQGEFNDLLFVLARNTGFRASWGLPIYTPEEEIRIPSSLEKNVLFAKMEDVELVLRFFALRNREHYSGGMQGFLDRYMVKSQRFEIADIKFLKTLFETTIHAAVDIFGKHVFRPYDPSMSAWKKNPSKAFYDAVMCGLADHVDHFEEIVARRNLVVTRTKKLFEEHGQKTFTGQGNTKIDVSNRIDLVSNMFGSVLK